MLQDRDHIPHTATEDLARKRVWVRVKLGMAAEGRRRRRRASLALIVGAFATTAVMLLLLVL